MNLGDKKIIIFSGPSGVGKTRIVERVIKKNPKISRVITATTRNQRSREVDGLDYIFLSEKEFKQKIANNEFLEYALVHGDYKGVLKTEIEKVIAKDKYPVFVIDVQGAMYFKKIIPKENLFLVFISPESIEILKQRMLMRQPNIDPEELEIRLNNAQKEMDLSGEYDHIIINKQNKMQDTINQILSLSDLLD
jgi:guanylate kinase